MIEKHHHLMIFCGEPSGDMRAASLVSALIKKNPYLTFSGIGGDHLEKAGVTTFANIKDLSVMGFTEVIKNLPRIKKIFNLAVEETIKQKPDAVIFVDYPGFNLRLAKILKSKGFKTIYYISPQIWAWKENRIHLIKKVIDRMMVLFPFEKDFYQRHDYPADFVGHPIVDEIIPQTTKEFFLKNLSLSPNKKTIGILPGSREKEILNLLKDMLLSARLILKQFPDSQFVLLKSKNINDTIFNTILKDFKDLNIKTTYDYYDALAAIDCAIVASGTASLEVGISGKPMVVIYRLSWISEKIFRLLIGDRIKHISLLNIISRKEIVKEFIQKEASPKNISKEILRLLTNTEYYQSIQKELLHLRNSLNSSQASERAAYVVLDELSKS